MDRKSTLRAARHTIGLGSLAVLVGLLARVEGPRADSDAGSAAGYRTAAPSRGASLDDLEPVIGSGDSRLAGEARTVELVCTPGRDRPFVARFVRDEDGTAIADGAVHVLEPADSGSRLVLGARCATFDGQGRIELGLPIAAPGCVLASAPGRSPAIVFPALDEDVPLPMVVGLARSGELGLHVIDRSAAGAGPLTAVVEVDARSLLAREQRGRHTTSGALAWTFPVGADGRASCSDLPAHAPLRLLLRSGDAVAYTHGEPLILGPGEARDLELAIGPGTDLTVRAVDEHDRAVADRRLGLLRGGVDARPGDERTVLLPGDEPKFAFEARTDAQGACVLHGVPSGAWWIAIAPTRRPWDAPDAEAAAPVAQRIVLLEHEARREIVLRTWRGLYIRGRIEVTDGRLFAFGATSIDSPGVILLAHRSGLPGGLTGQPELDGSFALGPVTDDEHVIETFSREYAPIEPIRARASDGPIVIRMQPGARIGGRAIDAASGAGVRSEVALTRLDGPVPEALGSSDDRGTFGFSGIPAGEYAVSAFAADGRSGVSRRRRVTPAEPVLDVEVLLEPREAGGPVRVVLEGKVAPGRVTLWRDGVCRAYSFFSGPEVVCLGSPEGEIEARLWIGDECVERRTLRVERGATTDLRFRR